MHNATICITFISSHPIIGESDGYKVKSKERDFPISDYPLLQTEFLYGSKTGTADHLNVFIAHRRNHLEVTHLVIKSLDF